MTEATTDLADAGIADEEELEEVVVLASVHVEVVERAGGRCLKCRCGTEDKGVVNEGKGGC